VFSALSAALQVKCSVYALDFRGRGCSGYAEPQSYTVKQYAADVRELMEQLQLTQAVFIGTSLGGLVTMQLAEEHPQVNKKRRRRKKTKQ
jgi:pimeloyl-ACP methyl ester carboxylesterase